MLLKQYIFAAYIMKKTIFYISVAAIAMAMASCGSKATEATDADSVAQAGKGAVTYKLAVMLQKATTLQKLRK